MGAKNCPETPRQKMINMMYIVLTAMLALNVASEVLEAFRLVDSSLILTLKAVDKKNEQVYTSFEQAFIENPAKVQEWKDKADNVRSISKEMDSYIFKLKEEVVRYSGAEPISDKNPYDPERYNFITLENDTLEIKKEDDLNGPSELMITQNKAKELKAKIESYKNELIKYIDETDKELIETVLNELDTPDPQKSIKDTDESKIWESQHFENVPLAAVLTMLSKMQIDVKNAEANVANYLYAQIDAGSFKFNKLGARVIANSNIVFQGEQYEAEVFLAAEDTTQQPEIFINGRPAEVKDGRAIYKAGTSEPGVFKWSGLIKYKTPAGIFKNYEFEQSYQVTKPSVTMSATKMNVFYKGLDNPFDISGGGIPKENLELEVENGKYTKSGDTYLIRPTELDEQGRRTKVSVYANIGGSRKLLGTSNWRVKPVPPPVAQVNQQSGGDIRKEVLEIQDGVMAVLIDFDFNYKYRVTEFELQTTDGGYTNIKKSNTNRFTAEQKDLLKRVKPGTWVYIGNIKAVGDDGTERNLDPISFKIR